MKKIVSTIAVDQNMMFWHWPKYFLFRFCLFSLLPFSTLAEFPFWILVVVLLLFILAYMCVCKQQRDSITTAICMASKPLMHISCNVSRQLLSVCGYSDDYARLIKEKIPFLKTLMTKQIIDEYWSYQIRTWMRHKQAHKHMRLANANSSSPHGDNSLKLSTNTIVWV